MRVLHVAPYFAPAFRYGGPPRSILGLCQGLISAGVEVEVYTTTANGDDELPAEVAGVDQYDGVRVRYFPRRRPRRFFGASGFCAQVEHALARVDLVHLHGLWNVPVWVGAHRALRLSVPYVVSPRGMLDGGSFAHHRLRKEICYSAWEKRYLRSAAFLHATSRSEKVEIEKRSLGPPIVCIPNGVFAPESSTLSSFRNKAGIPLDVPLVVYLGRLHPTKRLDLLVGAMERVWKDEPQCRLVVAGPADGLDPRALDSGPKAATRVHVTGALDECEKWSLLSTADVLVLCSDSESFGLSVVEALAAGTPAIATRTCPWAELEREGCGLWVEQDVESIAKGVSTILTDRDRARTMGSRGRELVKRRYSWPAIGREMATYYQQIVESRRGAA
jgi:glycosyltransferase involved in cell wall biosynthesis